MAVHPLRPATRRRLGRPLPHQQADRPRAHPTPQKLSTMTPTPWSYVVLDPVSQAYPEVQGRSPTCYSPVRHSSTPTKNGGGLSVRLACVKHAASVRPEPGSNSPKKQTKKQNRQKTKKPTKQKQTTNTTNAHVRVRVHVHVQTKFASSNDTLSSSQTTPPPTTQNN